MKRREKMEMKTRRRGLQGREEDIKKKMVGEIRMRCDL